MEGQDRREVRERREEWATSERGGPGYILLMQ